MFLERFPMTKTIQDDFSDVSLSIDDDVIYTLTVTKRGENDEGQRQLLKLEMDIGEESYKELIQNRFEGKKVLKRWQRWVPATAQEKASNPDAKGHWESVAKRK